MYAPEDYEDLLRIIHPITEYRILCRMLITDERMIRAQLI